MTDENAMQQGGNTNDEFEYIEIEDGQDLPHGYEYDYIDAPADEVSEIDVVNRPHSFSQPAEDAQTDFISSANMSSHSFLEEDENRHDAPFPSFLMAKPEKNEDDDWMQNAASENYSEPEMEINETKEPEYMNQSDENETWQAQVGNVKPSELVEKDNIHFMNDANTENWQADTRAMYDLDEVSSTDTDMKIVQNDVSSINVNDYIEPEAVHKVSDIALDEVPPQPERRSADVMPENVQENLGDNKEAFANDDDFSELDDDNEISLDELLQDDTPHEHEFMQENDVQENDVQENDIQDDVVRVKEEVSAEDDLSNQADASTEDVVMERVVTDDVPTETLTPEIDMPENDVLDDGSSLVEKTDIDNMIENQIEEFDEEVADVMEEPISQEEAPVEEIASPIEEVSENISDTTDEPIIDTISEEVSQPSFDEENTVVQNEVSNVWEDLAPDVDTISLPDEVSETRDDFTASDMSAATAAIDLLGSSDNVIISSEQECDQINLLQDDFSVEDYTQEEREKAENCSRIVSKQDGVQAFHANANVSDILLSGVDFTQNELNAWNLILYKKNILPLDKKVMELSMPKNSRVNRFASIVQVGNNKADFFNEENLKIINATHACVAVQGHFICGDFENNSGLIVDDFSTYNLADYAGKKLAFSSPVSGLLTGPNGCVLFFFNVQNLWVSNSDVEIEDAQKLQYKISKWYSGTLHDKYFEFSAQSENAEFIGNEEMNSIHVNVNNSSYGWNVSFENGISMNLRDLREYQTRFGKLPFSSGTISYGQKTLKFQNVERIVVYEAAQYFFYS